MSPRGLTIDMKQLCAILLAVLILTTVATIAVAAHDPYDDYLAFVKDVVSAEGTQKSAGFVELVSEVNGKEAAANIRKTLAAQDEPWGVVGVQASSNKDIVVDYINLKTYDGFKTRDWLSSLLAGDIIYDKTTDTHYMNATKTTSTWEDWKANHMAAAVVMPEVIPVYLKGKDTIPVASFLSRQWSGLHNDPEWRWRKIGLFILFSPQRKISFSIFMPFERYQNRQSP